MQTTKVTVLGSRLLRLTDFQELVGVNIIQSLMNTRWPHHFYLSAFRRSEAKMKTLVICRSVAAGGGRESRLSVYFDSRAESITVAACAAQRNDQPVQLAPMAEEHLRVASEIGHHDVFPSVII